jgi:hypothetical protein
MCVNVLPLPANGSKNTFVVLVLVVFVAPGCACVPITSIRRTLGVVTNIQASTLADDAQKVKSLCCTMVENYFSKNEAILWKSTVCMSEHYFGCLINL